jgi:hypothetical protein
MLAVKIDAIIKLKRIIKQQKYFQLCNESDFPWNFQGALH